MLFVAVVVETLYKAMEMPGQMKEKKKRGGDIRVGNLLYILKKGLCIQATRTNALP